MRGFTFLRFFLLSYPGSSFREVGSSLRVPSGFCYHVSRTPLSARGSYPRWTDLGSINLPGVSLTEFFNFNYLMVYIHLYNPFIKTVSPVQTPNESLFMCLLLR